MRELAWRTRARVRIALLSHTRDFDLSPPTAFRRAVTTLNPNATGRDMVRMLDGKAKRTTALDWYAGRHHAPRWALERLAHEIQARANELAAIAAEVRQTKERPGLKAGALNLAKWRARKNA